MNRWNITLVFSLGLVTGISADPGFAQIVPEPSIFMDAPREIPVKDIFERTDAPLNERLVMKYIRQVELERRLKKIVRFTASQSAGYDSNVFESSGNDQNNNKKSDLVYTTRAEINVNLIKIENPHLPDFFKEGGFNLGLTYLWVYDSYHRNKDLNDKDHIFGLDLRLPTLQTPLVRRGLGRKLEVTMREDFHPEEFTNVSFTTERDRELRFVNDFSTVLVYPITHKTFFSLPYINQFIRYKDSELKDFNSMSHTFAPTLSCG